MGHAHWQAIRLELGAHALNRGLKSRNDTVFIDEGDAGAVLGRRRQTVSDCGCTPAGATLQSPSEHTQWPSTSAVT